MCWFSACTIISQIVEKQRTIWLSKRALLVSRKTTSNIVEKKTIWQLRYIVLKENWINWMKMANQWYLIWLYDTQHMEEGEVKWIWPPDIAMPINHINLSQLIHIWHIRYQHCYYIYEYIKFMSTDLSFLQNTSSESLQLVEKLQHEIQVSKWNKTLWYVFNVLMFHVLN